MGEGAGERDEQRGELGTHSRNWRTEKMVGCICSGQYRDHEIRNCQQASCECAPLDHLIQQR